MHRSLFKERQQGSLWLFHWPFCHCPLYHWPLSYCPYCFRARPALCQYMLSIWRLTQDAEACPWSAILKPSLLPTAQGAAGAHLHPHNHAARTQHSAEAGAIEIECTLNPLGSGGHTWRHTSWGALCITWTVKRQPSMECGSKEARNVQARQLTITLVELDALC